MNNSLGVEQFTYQYVTDIDAARHSLAAFLSEEVIALDTETHWDARAGRSRVALVQIASRAGRVVVLDALAVSLDVARKLIESPRVKMAAHNANFDEAMLAGEGLKPAAFVDTLRLARSALLLPSYSLQSVVAHLFGVALDKNLQRSNWRRRPLTEEQLRYAALDARITLRLFDELRRILEEQGRWTPALTAATLRPRDGGEKRPRRQHAPQPPSPPLTGEEQRIVLELKKWRLEQAHAGRVPAYMICSDRTLEDLARRRPLTLDQLGGIYGLGEAKITRYGEELLNALRELTKNS